MFVVATLCWVILENKLKELAQGELITKSGPGFCARINIQRGILSVDAFLFSFLLVWSVIGFHPLSAVRCPDFRSPVWTQRFSLLRTNHSEFLVLRREGLSLPCQHMVWLCEGRRWNVRRRYDDGADQWKASLISDLSPGRRILNFRQTDISLITHCHFSGQNKLYNTSEVSAATSFWLLF